MTKYNTLNLPPIASTCDTTDNGAAAAMLARAAGEYRPAPQDTSAVVLSPDVDALTELLARNTHEVWATQRLAEGWRYGPVRDDAAKEHPSLIPYDLLSESEKDYDRRTSREVLRLIVALGFEIRRREA